MTDELKREYEKLEEIEVRYHQVMDTYREHIHQNEVHKWQADEEAYKQISTEWQVQMDKIRRIADEKETAEEKEAAEEQHIDELKEQVEDEFVPEEDQTPKYELNDMCLQYRDLVGLVLEKGWYDKATPQQWNMFVPIAGCKHDVTLRDVAEHACNICNHSSNANLADVIENLLQNLEVKNVWIKTT